MFIVAELYFTDGGHVPFNSGFLATVRTAFPSEDVCFFGARKHIKELKQQMGMSLAASILWREIEPPRPGLSYFRRLFREIKLIRNMMRSFPGGPTAFFVSMSSYPSTLMALKLVKRFRFQRIPAQVILHSLDGITGRRYRRPILRFQDMNTALTLFGNNRMRYLVLEESIRDDVLKALPCLSGKVETIDHPLPPNEAGSNTHDLNLPVRFGFLGLANESKGFPLFVKLANEIGGKDRAEFHAVGRLPDDGNAMTGISALATRPGLARLSRAQFIEGVKSLHFIIFPFQEGHYLLTASGTLLDAIAWERPLIARRIPIFERMFEKYGDIGYLFSNDAELREIVEHISQTVDAPHYQRQVSNIRKARCSRSPDALARSYRAICRET